MDAKPSQALRQGRWKSSMWLAIDAVKKGEADAAVSAGNTGALMAMAKFNLRTMPGIERPGDRRAMADDQGRLGVLDVGASIGADADHLVDLAVMGSAMARVLFDLERPTVGLLNIGVEEVKGLEWCARPASSCVRRILPFLDYVGFVEADMIGQGAADVIVTEGFRRQHRDQDRGGNRKADHRACCAPPCAAPGAPGSAICSRAMRS